MTSRRQFIEYQWGRQPSPEFALSAQMEAWLREESGLLDHLIRVAAENEREERRTRAYLTSLRDGEPLTCASCGVGFHATRADAEYCSAACRQKAYRQRERDATAKGAN